jgi:phosphoribosylformylglycinamidine cyclo-ligase
MSSDTKKDMRSAVFRHPKKMCIMPLKNIDKGLFPQAFCKIPDYLTQDEDYCLIMHADGAGTKSFLHTTLERNR